METSSRPISRNYTKPKIHLSFYLSFSFVGMITSKIKSTTQNPWKKKKAISISKPSPNQELQKIKKRNKLFSLLPQQFPELNQIWNIKQKEVKLALTVGKVLLVYEISMQVLPTAPSPTVTHFINLDPLISVSRSKTLLFFFSSSFFNYTSAQQENPQAKPHFSSNKKNPRISNPRLCEPNKATEENNNDL